LYKNNYGSKLANRLRSQCDNELKLNNIEKVSSGSGMIIPIDEEENKYEENHLEIKSALKLKTSSSPPLTTTISKGILKSKDYKTNNINNTSKSKNNKVIFDQESSESEYEKGEHFNNIKHSNHRSYEKTNTNTKTKKTMKDTNENKNDNSVDECDSIPVRAAVFADNKNNSKSQLRSSSKNLNKEVNLQPESSEGGCFNNKRITRSCSTKQLDNSKNQSQNNFKVSESNNKINFSSKNNIYKNYRSNNSKKKKNSNNKSNENESDICSHNNNETNSISQEMEIKFSSSSEKNKSNGKSASKASSSLNLHSSTSSQEKVENNKNNSNNYNESNNYKNPKTSKNASTTNLLSTYNSCGEADENQADPCSDITKRLSNSLIYCRDSEKQKVLDFISNKDLKTLFICGQPGTGKTCLLLEIFKKDLGASTSAIKIYINCMSVHSAEDFYFQILKFLFENYNLLQNNPKNLRILQSYRELLNFNSSTCNKKNLHKSFLEILDLYKSKFTFLILLDEVDNFYQKQKEIVFYDILKTPYLTDSLLKLMLISNNSEFDKDVMPKIESRKIKVSRIVFQPYTHNEIYAILRHKLIDSGILEVFQDEALKLISKKLANKMGDMRPAIEIVKNLILENKAKISVSAIRENKINNNITDNKSLNTQFPTTHANDKNENTDNTNKLKSLTLINESTTIESDIKAEAVKPLITLRDVLIKLKQKNQGFLDLMSNLTTEQKIVLLSFYIVYEKSKNNEMDERFVLETYKRIKRENFNSEFSIMDYKEIIKSFCDMAIIECKNKAKGKFKIRYDLEDLELIFVDDKIFKMFKGN